MSDDPSPSKETPAETTGAAPRVRRISNPRPKKTAAKGAAAVEPAAAEPEAAPAPAAAPADAPTASTVTEAQAAQDWPDAETVSDASGQSANDKRKRRRRKGKGGGQQGGQNHQGGQAPVNEEVLPLGDAPAPKASAPAQSSAQPAPAPRPVQAPGPPPQQQHPQHARGAVNQELLAKRAWKIFLAEVSEEGVSLISDHDARELSKRCFRLAEIFLDEQGRKLR